MIDLMYQPQLIVGYDTLGDLGDLVHISKAIPGKDYYCPCCGGVIRARAKESDLIQEHFYHLNGNCDSESQIHFMYKNWLMKENSKFYVEDDLYEVDHIDIEKSWDTSLGIYRPDITVYTTDNKRLFLELYFTSNKDENYIYKWQELDSDVVEVDIKKMMTLDKIDTPRFEYLYHDGQFYKKEYHKGNLYANTIGARKEEIRRQDYLNYKAHWEKLDWFYKLLREIATIEEDNGHSQDQMLESFKQLDLDDMYPCYENIKRTNCVKLYASDCKSLINNTVIKELEKKIHTLFSGEHYEIKKESPYIWNFRIKYEVNNNHIFYRVDVWRCLKFRGSLFKFEHIQSVLKELELYSARIKNMKAIVNKSNKILSNYENNYGIRIRIKKAEMCNVSELHIMIYDPYKDEFVDIIKPEEFDPKNYCCIEDLIKHLDKINDKVNFIEFKNNIQQTNLLKEWISNLDVTKIENELLTYIDDDIIQFFTKYSITPKLMIKKPYKYNHTMVLSLYLANKSIWEKKYHSKDEITDDKQEWIQSIKDNMSIYRQMIKDNTDIINKINNCKNGYWKARLVTHTNVFDNNYTLSIDIYNTEKLCSVICHNKVKWQENIIDAICKGMHSIITGFENYGYGFYTEEEVKQHEQKRS